MIRRGLPMHSCHGRGRACPSLPDSFRVVPRLAESSLSLTHLGWLHAWLRVPQTLLPRKGPSTPNPTPCHYMLYTTAPLPIEPSFGGGVVPRDVVARGGRVKWWGPCGCQATRLDEALLGIPSRRTKKCQGERAESPPDSLATQGPTRPKRRPNAPLPGAGRTSNM